MIQITFMLRKQLCLDFLNNSIFEDEVEIGYRKVDGNQLKWFIFHDFPAQRMYSAVQEWVFPYLN